MAAGWSHFRLPVDRPRRLPGALPVVRPQEVFAPFVHHPRYAELMDNITRVTDYFNRRVEEHVAAGAGAQLSVER